MMEYGVYSIAHEPSKYMEVDHKGRPLPGEGGGHFIGQSGQGGEGWVYAFRRSLFFFHFLFFIILTEAMSAISSFK